MANSDSDKKQLQDEVVLDDNQLVCVLTNTIKTATEKELLLQSIINQMDVEYEFEMSDMKRDYSFSYENDEGKKKRITIDLAIFRHNAEKEPENLERICIVHDSKVKEGDKRKVWKLLYTMHFKHRDVISECGPMAIWNILHIARKMKSETKALRI